MSDDDGFPCEGDDDYCAKSPAPVADPWHSWQWRVGGRCQWCGAVPTSQPSATPPEATTEAVEPNQGEQA